MDLSPCVRRVIARADSYINEHGVTDLIDRAAVAIDFFYCFERGDEPKPDRDVPQLIRYYLVDQQAVDTLKREKDGEIERVKAEYGAELGKVIRAANSILWMARAYAEAGGRHGPEMRDYEEAEAIIKGETIVDGRG